MNNNIHISGWLRVIALLVCYLFVIGVFNSIGLLSAGIQFENYNENKTILQSLIISFFNLLGTLLTIFFFVKIVDRENFIDIGLKLKNRVKAIISGILLGLIIMCSAFVLLLSLGQIVYNKTVIDYESLLYLFLLFIIVSVTEEFLFRGYVLRNFMYSFSKPVALLTSAFLFSIIHGYNPNFDLQAFINLFLAGILLGLPYTFNKNLWFPIALHFSWNFFQSLFGFNVSGQNTYSLIESEISEPNLINGGEFGFEGSILSIIVQIILIVCIFIYYTNKSKKKEFSK